MDDDRETLTMITSGTLYLRAYYTLNGCWSDARVVDVNVDEFAPEIAGIEQVTAGTNVTLNSSGCDGSYYWQWSNDGITWTTDSTATSTAYSIAPQEDTYVRLVTIVGAPSYSPVHYIAVQQPITNDLSSFNYIKEETLLTEVTDAANLSALTTSQKAVTYRYMDGLGRTVQGVSKAATPSGQDIISFNTFDALGVTNRSYLPYTSTGSDYYTNHLNDQETFYNNQGYAGAYAFSEATLEASPRRRVLEQGAPGSDWQLGSGHAVSYAYRFNNSGEVLKWAADGSSTTYYAASELDVVEMTDENGHLVTTYTDHRGNLILKRYNLMST